MQNNFYLHIKKHYWMYFTCIYLVRVYMHVCFSACANIRIIDVRNKAGNKYVNKSYKI